MSPFFQTAELMRQLTRDEGMRLKPYSDSVGKLTIGVGRNLTDCGISGEEAQFLLEADVRKAAADVEKYLPWALALDQARLGALINCAFNLGIGGLLKFRHALEALQAGNYGAAAEQLLDSEWASQVGPRAVRIAEQIKTGSWM
jgi:lysozyme